MFSRHSLSWIILILFLILYLVFPAGSSTLDAWYYASSVKYNSDIFHPHHLLYNLLGSVFCFLPVKIGIDILAALKVMNTIFAILSLLVVQRILYLLKADATMVVLISCLCGVSFSVMRYATENETYIVPLFFALLATYEFLKWTLSGENKHVVSTAIWIILSVLFHQVFFFWWMGLMIGFISLKRISHLLIYLLVSLAGPAVYLIAIYLTRGNIKPDTITDFLLGILRTNSYMGITAKGLFLSLASLIRSFIQIHGYMLNMIKSNILFIIPAVISVSVFIMSLFRLPARRHKVENLRFTLTIYLIIIMQFIFAVFSYGNVKFMVMIPVLTFILIPVLTFNSKKWLRLILTGLAIWNISYGLIPLHLKSSAPEQFMCDESRQSREVIVIASDKQLLKNMIHYQTGTADPGNIYKSPASFKIKGNDPAQLESIIDEALEAGRRVLTDCIDPIPVSRASIIEGNLNSVFFGKYKIRIVKSWDSFLGEKSVYEVTGKL